MIVYKKRTNKLPIWQLFIDEKNVVVGTGSGNEHEKSVFCERSETIT